MIAHGTFSAVVLFILVAATGIALVGAFSLLAMFSAKAAVAVAIVVAAAALEYTTEGRGRARG